MKSTVFGIWLMVFAMMILYHCLYSSPIDSLIRMESLLSKLMNLSFLLPQADCIMTLIGAGYIIASVEILHGQIFGQLLAFILSLVMMLTFDNLFFTTEKGLGQYLMPISHLINMVISISLYCTKESEEITLDKDSIEFKNDEHIDGEENEGRTINPEKKKSKVINK